MKFQKVIPERKKIKLGKLAVLNFPKFVNKKLKKKV
jgi:hypothetical protein